MSSFEYSPQSSGWKAPVQAPNNWFRRFANRFSRNPIGELVVRKWREWVWQPIVISVKQPLGNDWAEEGMARGIGKYFAMPKTAFEYERAKAFMPMDDMPGNKEAEAIEKMNKRKEELGHLIRAKMGHGTAATSTTKAKLLDKFKKAETLILEHEKLTQFLLAYQRQQQGYTRVEDEAERAKERGEAEGVMRFEEEEDEDGNPIEAASVPNLPGGNIKRDYEKEEDLKETLRQRDSEYRELVIKEINGELSEAESKKLEKMRLKQGRSSVKFGDNHYVMSVGRGAVMKLFREIVKERSFGRFMRACYNWRAYKTAGAYPIAGDKLWKWHFNLGKNSFQYGESPEGWLDRTSRNFTKMVSDGEGRTQFEKMYNEIIQKRLWQMDVKAISGEAYKKAIQFHSTEFAGQTEGLIEKRNIAAKDVITLDELTDEELTAIHGYYIATCMPGNHYRVPPMTQERRDELNEKLKEMRALEAAGKPVNQSILKLIEKSIEKEEDYLAKANWANLETREWMKYIRPWTELIVHADGMLDVAKVQYRKGDMSPYLPPGARRAVIPKYDLPTVLSRGLVTMRYVRSYKPFTDRIVRIGKELDTSMGGLIYTHRQIMKGLIGNFLHDGSQDDGADIPVKVAWALRLNPSEATRMWLVLHEATKRWDGSKYDHLRSHVDDLISTFDEQIRAFYFGSGVETSEYPEERDKMVRERTKFIKKTVMNQTSAEMIARYYDASKGAAIAREKANAEKDPVNAEKFRLSALEYDKQAEGVREEFNKYITLHFGDDLAPATHKAEMTLTQKDKFTEIEVPKRVRKVTDWILGNSVLFKVLFIKHSTATAGPGASVVLNAYVKQESENPDTTPV